MNQFQRSRFKIHYVLIDSFQRIWYICRIYGGWVIEVVSSINWYWWRIFSQHMRMFIKRIYDKIIGKKSKVQGILYVPITWHNDLVNLDISLVFSVWNVQLFFEEIDYYVFWKQQLTSDSIRAKILKISP